MIKIVVLCIVLMINSLDTFAQHDTTFNVTIENNSHSSATSIIKTDIGYLSIGFGNVNGWNGLKTVALDHDGNVLKINGYYEPNKLYLSGWSSLHAYTDTSYIVPVLVEDSTGSSIGQIWEFDKYGDTVKTYSYKYHNGASTYATNRFISMDVLSDGSYLVTGYASATPITSSGSINTDLWLLKLSSTLSIQWSKVFGGSRSESSNNTIEMRNGDLILGGRIQELGSTDPLVCRLSSNGGVKWTKNLGTTGTDSEAFVSAAEDGGYYVACRLDTIVNPNYQSSPLVIYKYDSIDSLRWSYYLSEYHKISITKISEVNSKAVILGAFTKDANDFSHGSVWKLDSNGQNIIEFTFYPPIPNLVSGGSVIYDVCYPGTGYFTSCGSAVDFTPSPSLDFWFFKADSNGCIAVDSNCITDTTGMDDIIITDNVSVYPNPTSNHLFVNASGQLVEFRLFSLMGQQMLSTSVTNKSAIDISELPPGLYLYELTTNNQRKLGKLMVE